MVVFVLRMMVTQYCCVCICAGVVSVAVGCRYLQVVYLRRCVNVSDEAVIALAHNCRQLRDLNIGGCTLVTDASLHALSESSSLLSSINFSRANVHVFATNFLRETVVYCSVFQIVSELLHLNIYANVAGESFVFKQTSFLEIYMLWWQCAA